MKKLIFYTFSPIIVAIDWVAWHLTFAKEYGSVGFGEAFIEHIQVLEGWTNG